MPGPGQGDRRDDKGEDLSDLATGYRKAAPYIAASTQLVAATGIFTALGWWADKKLEHTVPWLLLLGAAVGATGGFVSFFKTVLGKKDS